MRDEDALSAVCRYERENYVADEYLISKVGGLTHDVASLTARLAEAEAAHLTDALVQEQLQRELAAAEALLATARETNRRLNARCQLAESAIPSYRKMVALPPSGDGIRFVSGSFGRALLAFECHRLDERLAAAQVRNECPECGLTPGAISTCFCEECVGELKQDLAECRRLLREACEMPRYCTRFEEWKERAAKAGGRE